MKTIINDHNMIYSVIQETIRYANGEKKYILGDEGDYTIEDYFSRDKLFHCIYYISIIIILLLILSLYQKNYIFCENGQSSTKYERFKLNTFNYSYRFNLLYSCLLFFFCLFIYNKEMNIYTWHYDCGQSDTNDTIQSSTYYYSIFNIVGAPDVYQLKENYLMLHPEMEESDCGNHGINCCRIDVTCNDYIEEHRPYHTFNSTMQRRKYDGISGTVQFGISNAYNDCQDHNIIHLIHAYVYSDRELFHSYVFYSFFIWFNVTSMISIFISCRDPQWKPLQTS